MWPMWFDEIEVREEIVMTQAEANAIWERHEKYHKKNG